jgi:hypothetical protein
MVLKKFQHAAARRLLLTETSLGRRVTYPSSDLRCRFVVYFLVIHLRNHGVEVEGRRMSLFRRRRSVRTEDAARLSSRLRRDQLVWLPGRIEVQVAGESFHQDAIETVEGRRSPDSPLPAVLVPEPGNPHDSHAVAVYVDGEHVGFLPRHVAAKVQSALVTFGRAQGGRLVSCPAEIRWHDVGPQVVLLLDPEALGLQPEAFDVVPDLAAAIARLLTRLDQPEPPLTGADQHARSALAEAEERRAEVEGNYDRRPGDWPQVESVFRSLVIRFSKAHDPLISEAWLGVGRATRYQRARRDDTLGALVEALYWGRSNAGAWSDLIEFASAAPHAPTLLALFARIPHEVRGSVLDQLLYMSRGHDRLGRMSPAAGVQLREGLLQVAEAQGDMATVATLTGRAGLEAEKAGDLGSAVGCWRRAVAAGSTDAKVADRFSIWLVKQHQYEESALVLRQALTVRPQPVEVAERMRRRLARCQRGATS